MVAFIAVLCFCSTCTALAQQQIPNADLEEWQLFPGAGAFRDYEEPALGWSSGNGAIHIAGGTNPLTTKTTDAVSGMYAAKMTTGRIFNLLASGSLFTGTFRLNVSNPEASARRGIPFQSRPTRFKGWYKYTPVGSDSGTLYATLSRWDGVRRVVIGDARMMQYTTVANYTEFDLTFMYSSDETPDTIAVVFASSANGANLVGDVGSTLFVDDLSLEYGPTSTDDEHDPPQIRNSDRMRNSNSTLEFIAATNALRIHSDAVVDLSVFDSCGNTVIITRASNSVVYLDQLVSGVYGVIALSFNGTAQRILCAVVH